MKQTISNKMVLQIVPVVFVIFAALVVAAVLMTANAQTTLAYQGAGDKAREYANLFDGLLREYQALSRTLAQTMEGYSSRQRSEVDDILKNLATKRTDILGTYVGYEPNAFDNKDAEFIDAAGSDRTGRLNSLLEPAAGKSRSGSAVRL